MPTPVGPAGEATFERPEKLKATSVQNPPSRPLGAVANTTGTEISGNICQQQGTANLEDAPADLSAQRELTGKAIQSPQTDGKEAASFNAETALWQVPSEKSLTASRIAGNTAQALDCKDRLSDWLLRLARIQREGLFWASGALIVAVVFTLFPMGLALASGLAAPGGVLLLVAVFTVTHLAFINLFPNWKTLRYAGRFFVAQAIVLSVLSAWILRASEAGLAPWGLTPARDPAIRWVLAIALISATVGGVLFRLATVQRRRIQSLVKIAGRRRRERLPTSKSPPLEAIQESPLA